MADAPTNKQRSAQEMDAGASVSQTDRYYLEERFQRSPGVNADLASATEATRVPANRDFEIVGTNSTSALCTFSAGGGITLTTAGADEDDEVVTPHLDTAQTAWAGTNWNTNDEVGVGTVMQTGANISDARIWAGLKLTFDNVIATDDDQVYFHYEDSNNGGRWNFVTSRAGTDVETDTGITVVLSTQYKLEIRVDSNRIPRGYIDGVLVATAAALTADIDLIPYIGVSADATAAKAITVRKAWISKEYAD